jgi:hypothetical protein
MNSAEWTWDEDSKTWLCGTEEDGIGVYEYPEGVWTGKMTIPGHPDTYNLPNYLDLQTAMDEAVKEHRALKERSAV